MKREFLIKFTAEIDDNASEEELTEIAKMLASVGDQSSMMTYDFDFQIENAADIMCNGKWDLPKIKVEGIHNDFKEYNPYKEETNE